MKRFVFELEQVLEIRNFEKQKAESELAKCLAVESEINNNLEIIAQQYIALKAKMKGNLDFSSVVSQGQYTNLLNYQKEELLKQLAEAKLVTQQKKEILGECIKKTTALEKMKEAQFEEYKAEIKKAEQKRIEEIATIKSFAESKR